MTSSPLGKGLLISIGGGGGALFGFWLQDRWMVEYRQKQKEMIRQIIKEEQELAAQEKHLERLEDTDHSLEPPSDRTV